MSVGARWFFIYSLLGSCLTNVVTATN